MSITRVGAAQRRRVQERAGGRCEHCLLSEEDAFFSHEPDHIIAEKHRGETVDENLAWSCFDCNRHKGSDIASRDPSTNQLTPLFDPRTQHWHEHFEFRDGRIDGITAIGRVTERLLKMNLPKRVEVRRILREAGRYPTAF